MPNATNLIKVDQIKLPKEKTVTQTNISVQNDWPDIVATSKLNHGCNSFYLVESIKWLPYQVLEPEDLIYRIVTHKILRMLPRFGFVVKNY